ncbi:hypothetical protein KVV02_007778 [Mortierella alpina]|uniref:PH domain-containing protein n=1 Tax=Mortierella alpina TaxID=64518 RepID=A0A9P7ZZZ9_MORAP|nr:hypothetical protein KVV02_007778 [Mortierella alpina]
MATHSATVEDPPFDLFSPSPTVASSQLSTTPALAVALRPHSRRSTPVQTTVFITTTDITGRGEKDCFRNSNTDHLSPQHQRRHRRPVLNRGRPSTGIEIQPLFQSPQHPHDQQRHQQQKGQTQEREHTFPVQSDFPAQVQGTLDFLEYLETYVASEDETKALERQRRLQSWTAVKDFISHRILRLNRNHKDESEDNVGYNRPRHFNHSSPLIDRSLLTPSPSPSLPTLRSAPLPFSLSRPSSPIPSVASTPEPSSTQRPHQRPSSLHGRLSLTGTGTGALSSASSTVHPGTHYRSASAGPSCYRSSSTRARNQLQSSTPVAATSSPSSSSYTIPRIIHTPPPSAMSSHTGSLLSSPISPTGTSCSSVLVPRSPFRRTSGSQHPLANVSTFDSDPEAYLASDEPLVLSNDALRNECQAPVTPSQKPAYYEEPAQELASTKTVIEETLTGQNDIATAPEFSMLMDSKHKTLGMVKSVFKSGSPQALVLTLKSEMSERSQCGAQEPNVTQLQNTNHSGSAAESDWATVAVASTVDQPLSPLTAAYPTTTSQSLVVPDRTEDLGSRTAPVAVQQSARSSTSEGSETGSSSPRRDFEKWTPPPPKPRPSQDAQRQSQPLRQPHSRLHLPRLLKQRSLNFTFSSSPSSSTPASPSSPQHSFPLARASMDGFLRRASTGPSPTEQRSMTTTSYDLPRPIGPPDPIPPHYQHLQNRHGRRSTSSFRRRSHGGELERFSPGWIVAENAAAAASVAAASSPSDHRLSRTGYAEHEEASQRRRHSTTPSRRHVSLGLQPNLSSMWGRLLTSIFSSGPGSDNGENEQRDGEGGASTPRELSSEQQRLLLTPLSQQQQVHPLYQQQLFFYADEVIDSDLEDMAINNNRRRSTSEASGLRRNSTSLLTALATDASLQGELAQEDGRESLEMDDLGDMVIVRPETLLGGDGSLVPKTLSPEGKISVASLALSSPPSYWEAAVKYQGWPQIDKRPEQGQESLPRYSCSVFREGCVNRKTELVGNWRPYRRPWKRTFAHLRGTALRLYAVDMEDVPRLHVRNISLQLAKCEIAADYKQRPNVIRIQACDRTVLLECKDRIDALTWLEHLQAAANISTSLEDRSMPKKVRVPMGPVDSAVRLLAEKRSMVSSVQVKTVGSDRLPRITTHSGST